MQRKTNWQRGYKIKVRRACNSGRNSPLNIKEKPKTKKRDNLQNNKKQHDLACSISLNAKRQKSRFRSRFSLGTGFGRAFSASACRRTPHTHWPLMKINRPVISQSCYALEKNYWKHRRRFRSEQGAACSQSETPSGQAALPAHQGQGLSVCAWRPQIRRRRPRVRTKDRGRRAWPGQTRCACVCVRGAGLPGFPGPSRRDL